MAHRDKRNTHLFTNYMKKSILSRVALGVLFFNLIACSKDDGPGSTPDPNPVALESEINDFVWSGLNEIYLWQQDVPNLADSKNDVQDDYYGFLNSYDTPNNLFNALLYQKGTVDRFSFLVDDYIELENSFAGIYKSNGVDFQLSRIGNSDDVFGFVRYIVNNSDASAKNIERGDFFLTVDGQQLTAQNYQTLLFGSNDTYTLGMAEVNNSQIALNGETVSLTKTELSENPILINKVIESNGQKIGYLMYNGFIADYDQELNSVFADFKAQGVGHLVLDLRYNPGGRVSSAIYLSSMITGQFTGSVFSKEEWNDKYQSYFENNDPDRLINKFTNKLSDNTTINSLGLQTVYILTTGSSASSSELVINGLDPYIDVRHIGDTTTGKYTASVTLYDSPNFGKSNINPDHKYAIQPLVLKSANANGVSDYFEGLLPDTPIKENITDMGILGDENEPLLAEAISQITGVANKAKRSAPQIKYILLKDVNDFKPLGKEMYIDTERIIRN